MSTIRKDIVAILLAIGLAGSVYGQEAASAGGSETAAGEIDKQLNIYRTTLLEGKTQQIRLDAATVMLFNDSPQARAMLLEVLTESDNTQARAAVCLALGRTRSSRRIVKSQEDFVEPVIAVLKAERDFPAAKLAAEATLVFPYEQVGPSIETVAGDGSMPAWGRLNAVYALRLHPDKRAVFKLVALLDDKDPDVCDAAEKALKSLGFEINEDPEVRAQLLRDLAEQTPESFLRRRLIGREEDVRALEASLDSWQKRYLVALDQVYAAKTDDGTRSAFLAEHLRSREKMVTVWALERIGQLWAGTNKPKLSEDLGQVLLGLISSDDPEVRLQTARLLSSMGELKPAEKLLARLEKEPVDEVATALFVALGNACYFASLPNSGVTVPPEVRKATLTRAADFLSGPDREKARKGADVIRKLLEQNGLAASEVGVYLQALATRYSDEQASGNGAVLRAELLAAMAGLCSQGSKCRAQAAELFRPVFKQALADKAESIRMAAADGLAHIDKSLVVKELARDLANDSSEAIRRKLIDWAGDVGDDENLEWLLGKLSKSPEGQAAFQAMLKILGRSDAAHVSEWMKRFAALPDGSRLTDQQESSFLAVAEQKAVSENRPELLEDVRTRLADLHGARGEYEQAAQYLLLLHGSAKTDAQKQALQAKLLVAYLRWPDMGRAVKLVETYLAKQDIKPDDPLVREIDGYLRNPPSGADPDALLEALTEIKWGARDARPLWMGQLKTWTESFAKAEPAPKQGTTSN